MAVQKKPKLINWQLPMKRVLYALIPIIAFSVYLFGWRALAMLVLCNALAFACEYAFQKPYKEPVTAAVFVTGTLFALSLPPLLPFWMAAVGIIFGVVFGKMVFGGFGRNVFNPALTGRAFIYISFGGYMTARCWAHPIQGALGGLLRWAPTRPDAVTGATPHTWLATAPEKLTEMGISPDQFTWLKLFLGNTAGCIGGTSALLVILGGLYLIWRKTANTRIIYSALVGYIAMQAILHYSGVAQAASPLHTLFSGSVLFGIVFYATDPVSASKTDEGRVIYGGFIGILSALMTTFSVWPEATMFAILLANMFAPITDYAIRAWKKKRKQAA